MSFDLQLHAMKGSNMKIFKFNNFSLVLASFLFTITGADFANAADGYVITGATKSTQNNNIYNGSKGNSGNIVEIYKGDTTGQTEFVVNEGGWANGGNGGNNGNNVINNTLKVTNVDYANYPAYRGGYITGGSGSVSNNSIIIDNSHFRGVYGGLIALNQYSVTGSANYNTVKITNGTVNSANSTTATNFRAGSIERGSGDVQYNTLEISGSKIQAPGTQQVNISSGLLQHGSGNAKYNQIIISGAKTTITRSTNGDEQNVIFGGRIQTPTGTSQEIVGNRAYIQNLEYINGNIVAGGSANNSSSSSSSSGVTLKDNIAVISGNTKIQNAYGSWVKGLNNANLSNNLIIVNLTPNENSAKISGNVYGSLNEAKNGGTSENSAVYFMNGTVGGVVGGGNLAKTGNTLILGDSTTNFGSRSAGKIENFEQLYFNVLKEGSNKDAVLNLTGADSSSLDGVTVSFLNQSTDSATANVLVGGNSGIGVNSLRNNGGGSNAIKALTQDIVYKQYNAKDEKIKITTLVVQNDIVENLLRNDQSTQATYNIGTTYSFAYKDLDLTEANKKYYLINSANSELTGYTNMKNYINSTISGRGETITHWDGTKGIVIDAYQTNQNYIIDNTSTFTRNLRGMFVSEDKKALYITSNGDAKENIGTTIGGDDFFTKFGQGKDGNTISVTPNGNLDLSTTIFDGGTGKNTLNVGKDENNPTSMNTITMQDVINFDTINFYLPNPKNGDVAIKIAGGSNTDVSKSNINVYIDDVSKFRSGRIHLLKADNGQVISDPGTVKVKAQIGAIATAEMNSLDLVYKGGSGGTSTNDQTKIFSEARLGGLGALWQGQYLIANHLDRVIPDAFSELFPYVIVEGYNKRFNTGSHVDTLGFNANAGFASKGVNSNGEFTMGPFLDYGFTNYDAYLDDGTHGDGKNYYIGGGFFGKQENNSGSYFEATFRIGQLVTEFNGDLTFNGVSNNYNFDLKSTYYAAHAGLGKVYDLNANNNLDIYGRFFYTHIESADTTLNGAKTEFDAVQSKKIKVGLKDDFKLNEKHTIYAGAAYEYEFDARAGGRVLVLGNNAEMKQPSLRGSTGIGEIGYQYKKDETLKFDIGVKGYVGKQEGVSAQMAISIAF